MSKDYLKLLIKRENKEVLGKKWINLWLLTLVLTATFISIAFSNGSMRYLSEKMNDPFTNWVDITKSYDESDFDGLRRELNDPSVQNHYLFSDVQSDNYRAYSFIGANNSVHYLQGRYFNNINSKLVHAILDESNVISNSAIPLEKLSDRAFGFIITEDVLRKLGYSDKNIPAYIDYLRLSEGADTLGVEMYDEERTAEPMPLLGVVKRLPGNLDMISSRFFLEQDDNDLTYPLDMNNLSYQRSLKYYVPEDVSESDFEEAVKKSMPDFLVSQFSILEDTAEEMMSWKPGRYVSIYLDDTDIPVITYQDIARRLKSQFKDKDVKRIYDYASGEYPLATSQYISINFNSLDSIKSFEKFANDKFKVKIEMSQVNAKENFNAVSIMANILSWAMIMFSLICIILFVVNLLQNYFQKVKRNLGTFKAFGMSTKELIKTYVRIVLAMVLFAILISLGITWGLELLLWICDIKKDGEFSFISLWSFKTLWAALIVVIAAVVTVEIVMKRLLKKTPGDLIYDRD